MNRNLHFRKKVNIIFSKFLSLKSEKQQAIINAALKEFSQKGFMNASTNEIVKEAGISKGLLFHYFNNKKDLFLFLYDHSMDIILKDFLGKINLEDRDVFNRMRQVAHLKMELLGKYPEMFNFVVAVNLEVASEVKGELDRRNKDITTTSYAKIFEGIDLSLFKEDIDIKRAIDIIIWSIEGFSNREGEKVKALSLKSIDYEKLTMDLNGYFDILKKSLYK